MLCVALVPRCCCSAAVLFLDLDERALLLPCWSSVPLLLCSCTAVALLFCCCLLGTVAGGSKPTNPPPPQIHWMRAARTDKGVSAVGQCVSLKMVLEPPGVLERINAALPEQIRVFGFGRTTNGFDSRKHCDRRRCVDVCA